LLFLGLLALLLRDGRHSFLLKARLSVFLLKVSRLLAFFAFFTLFSYDFLSCCYFVVLEILLEFRLGLGREIRLAQKSFLFILEFKKEPNSR